MVRANMARAKILNETSCKKVYVLPIIYFYYLNILISAIQWHILYRVLFKFCIISKTFVFISLCLVQVVREKGK